MKNKQIGDKDANIGASEQHLKTHTSGGTSIDASNVGSDGMQNSEMTDKTSNEHPNVDEIRDK